MTPEERLIAALKAQNKIVFGNTIGSDSGGECTVVSDESTIRAIAGNSISAGSCVAIQADNGQWYAVSGRESGSVQKTTLYKRKNKPASTGGFSNIIILFKKGNTLYIGGDRDNPELIYELEDGFKFVQKPTINKTGTGQDDWIVNLILVSNTDSTSYKFCAINNNQLFETPLTISPELGFDSTPRVFQKGLFTTIDPGIEALPQLTDGPDAPTAIAFPCEEEGSDFIALKIVYSSAPATYKYIHVGYSSFRFIRFYTLIDILTGINAVYMRGIISSEIISNHPTDYYDIFLGWGKLSDYVNCIPQCYRYKRTGNFRSFVVDVLGNTFTIDTKKVSYPSTDTLPLYYSSTKSTDSFIDPNSGAPVFYFPLAVNPSEEYVVLSIYDVAIRTFKYGLIQGAGEPFVFPVGSFNTPNGDSNKALFPNGDDRNGRPIFVFSSPNLVGSRVFSVALADLTLSTNIDVVTTLMNTGDLTISFSLNSYAHTGIDDDMATHVIDASAYID